MKATYGEITHFEESESMEDDFYIESREIFKDPITDDGTKKSKKGLLQIIQTNNPHVEEDGQIWVKDQCTWEEESKGLLTTVFKDSKLVRKTTLDEIREKLNN